MLHVTPANYFEATPLRSECLLDLNARQRGVDANAKSTGNADRLQLSATSPHHREVVSGGSHHAFLRPADGCADAEAPLAGPHPSDACRPPSAPCGVDTGPTRWTAISTWQYPDGHTPPTNGTTSASRRPPSMGTRWPIPLLSTGKPLRGATPTHHHHPGKRVHSNTNTINLASFRTYCNYSARPTILRISTSLCGELLVYTAHTIETTCSK